MSDLFLQNVNAQIQVLQSLHTLAGVVNQAGDLAALGDDAERPRYIETIPRRGYRFIGLRDLPLTRQLYEEPVYWRQLKGDPSIRSTVFHQNRVESIMDQRIDLTTDVPSRTYVVPSGCSSWPALNHVPHSGAPFQGWWNPYWTMFSGSKSALVASLPFASTVRILPISVIVSQLQSTSEPSGITYGSPYAAGGIARPASSKSEGRK